MIKRVIFLFLAVFFAAFTQPAFAVDLPLKTWEAGKQHAIVVSGPGASDEWTLSLIGENSEPRPFKLSGKSAKGVYVFSIDLPRTLPVGAYVVTLDKPNRDEVQIAFINVIPRQSYTITEIPSDLRLLVLIFALITGLFTVIRAKKYSNLSFDKYVRESKNFFYRFRSERLAYEGSSLARFVTLRSGEPLHRTSPLAWSLLPWLSIPVGIATALKIQFDAAIPNGPIALFFICAIFGALDATSGIALALSLGFMHVALGNVTNLRSLVVAVVFSLSWYFPAMIAALLHLTLSFDFKRVSPQIRGLISAFIAATIAGLSVVMFTILTDSLVINRESSPLLRWPLAFAVGMTILLKYLLEPLVKRETIEKEKLFVARVVSPGLATTLFLATILLVYVWTNQFSSALLAALIISTPYFLLFVIFPKIGTVLTARIGRNLLVEALVVTLLAYAVYLGIQALPVAVISKSKAFILLGLVPNLLHAIYSVVIASAEFAPREKEMEAIS